MYHDGQTRNARDRAPGDLRICSAVVWHRRRGGPAVHTASTGERSILAAHLSSTARQQGTRKRKVRGAPPEPHTQAHTARAPHIRIINTPSCRQSIVCPQSAGSHHHPTPLGLSCIGQQARRRPAPASRGPPPSGASVPHPHPPTHHRRALHTRQAPRRRRSRLMSTPLCAARRRRRCSLLLLRSPSSAPLGASSESPLGQRAARALAPGVHRGVPLQHQQRPRAGPPLGRG